MMSNTNDNDKKFEQQKSADQKASLENQVEGNYAEEGNEAAERIEKNLEDAKGNK